MGLIYEECLLKFESGKFAISNQDLKLFNLAD